MSYGKIKIDPADTAFSKWIRNRDGWRCQRCFKKYDPPTSALHCSHYIGRRNEATRYEPLNCDAMCYGCHAYFGANPQEHTAWQIARKGQATVDKLRILANTYKKKDRKLEAIYWRELLKKQEESSKLKYMQNP